MSFLGKHISSLPTPAFIIDKEVIEANCREMLATAAESQVMQNIAVNIYSQYFDYEDEATEPREDRMMTRCVFRDPEQVGWIIIFIKVSHLW